MTVVTKQDLEEIMLNNPNKSIQEIIYQYVVESGDFPFEMFGLKKEDVKTEYGSYEFEIHHLDNENDKILVSVSYLAVNSDMQNSNLRLETTTITQDKERPEWFDVSNVISTFIKSNEALLEYQRTTSAYRDGPYSKTYPYSKYIVRCPDKSMLAIKYSYDYDHSEAYENVSTNEDEKLLDIVGPLNIEEIEKKLKEAKLSKKGRADFIQNLLNDELNRNSNFIKLVDEGLTTDETFALVRLFVQNLPYSMDSLSTLFVPGKAFFQQPNDLKQENNRRFDYDGYRTISEAMIKWGDTYENASVIALCVLFQQMLLEPEKYSFADLISIMKEKRIIKPTEGCDDQSCVEYQNERNKKLEDIAREMLDHIKEVNNNTGEKRRDALINAYRTILKASGMFPLIKDLEMYYHFEGISNREPVKGFEEPSEEQIKKEFSERIGTIKRLLDMIYNDPSQDSHNKWFSMVNTANKLIGNPIIAGKIIRFFYNYSLDSIIRKKIDDLFEDKDGCKKIKERYLDILGQVDLSGVSFDNVDIRGVDFSGTNVSFAEGLNPHKVFNKDLSGCNFTGIMIPWGLDFYGVNIKGTKLSGNNMPDYYDDKVDEDTSFNGNPVVKAKKRG